MMRAAQLGVELGRGFRRRDSASTSEEKEEVASSSAVSTATRAGGAAIGRVAALRSGQPVRVETARQGRAVASTGFIPVSGSDRCDSWRQVANNL
jgi:hypothetical protein